MVPRSRVQAVAEAIVFDVEQAGCASCAALIRDVLEEVVPVDEVVVDEAADRATVRLAPGGSLTEHEAARLLVAASAGTGHAYAVAPGSWRTD
jgi:copper chaperone CopZ